MAVHTIFLIGFMGSGKTTIGKLLAAKLNLKFIDLDEALCINYNVNDVKTFIEERGFDAFRDAESSTLQALQTEDAVISTGGGTPCYFDNIDWMKRRGVVVFLNVNEGVLFSRLKNSKRSERPLLKDLDDEGLKEFIDEKLKDRLPYYNQAHIIFNPVNEKLESLIERIATIIP